MVYVIPTLMKINIKEEIIIRYTGDLLSLQARLIAVYYVLYQRCKKPRAIADTVVILTSTLGIMKLASNDCHSQGGIISTTDCENDRPSESCESTFSLGSHGVGKRC